MENVFVCILIKESIYCIYKLPLVGEIVGGHLLGTGEREREANGKYKYSCLQTIDGKYK